MILTTCEGNSIGLAGRGISISEASDGPRKFSQGFTGVGVMVGVGDEVGVGVEVFVGVDLGVFVWVGREVTMSVGLGVIELPVMGSGTGRSHAFNIKQVKYKKRI
jgi:hypothetical protein